MKPHLVRKLTIAWSMSACLAISLHASPEPIVPDLAGLVSGEGWTSNQKVTAIEKDGRPAVRFEGRESTGLAWMPTLLLGDGTIECDLRGHDAPGRSFVGIAFHGLDATTYEAVYFRPFNFRPGDPARRTHAMQYISHPDQTWNRLRKEHPGKYEASLEPAPDPEGWFHVRIVIEHPVIKVYVDDAAEPALVVETLSNRETGWVGLWADVGVDAAFANLKVTPKG